MVRFSKFTLNVEIYEEFVEFFFKLVSRETLFARLHPTGLFGYCLFS